jgi:hypothetical protein
MEADREYLEANCGRGQRPMRANVTLKKKMMKKKKKKKK